MAKGKKADSGRILYFEPNPPNNQPIDNEDLSIAIELTATRKNRTIISVTNESDTAIVTNSNGNLNLTTTNPIQFINGSGDGSGPLTTNYTELNTDLGDSLMKNGDNLEGLGITSIDINFNTSYAPEIDINFVDVRGGSVFGPGNDSKYKVFFELPYPIFSLKVKGYYGKAVEYCLHLTKWNGKFNSKTGNFEIHAKFIGFTYALLTDSLLGYMRAIPETTIGKVKFNKFKNDYCEGDLPSAPNDKLITLNELLTRVHELNERVTKLKKDDVDIKTLQDSKGIKNELDGFRDNANFLVDKVIDDSSWNDRRGLVVIKAPKNDKVTIDKYQQYITEYNERLTTKIKEIQTSTNITIDETKLNDIRVTKNVTKSGLTEQSFILQHSNYKDQTDDTLEVIKKIKDRTRGKFSDNTLIWVYDLRIVYKEVKRLEDEYIDKIKADTKKVSDKLATLSKDILGFKPNLKNLFRIITTHVEVFLETIACVADNAEKNPDRTKELGKQGILRGLNVNKETGSDIPKIYPFPQYNEDSGDASTGGAKETWLGSVVEDSTIVDEVDFVENLLEALLKIKKADIDNAYKSNNNTDDVVGEDWYPVSSHEIRLDETNENPYSKIEKKIHHEEFLRVLYLRGFSLLHNNYKLNQNELNTYGKLEAQNMISTMEDEVIKKALLNSFVGADNTEKANNLIDLGAIGFKNITNPKIENVGDNSPFFTKSGTDLFYKYIRNRGKDVGEIQYAIPINGNFDGNAFISSDGSNKISFNVKFLPPTDLQNITSSFIFNGETNHGQPLLKIHDGSVYKNKYGMNPQFGGEIIEKFDPKFSELDGVSLLRQNANVTHNNIQYGFNPFADTFKIQEFGSLIPKGGGKTSNFSFVYMDSEVTLYGLNLADNYLIGGDNRQLDKYFGFDSKSHIVDKDDRYSIQLNNKLYNDTIGSSTPSENAGLILADNGKDVYTAAKGTKYPFHNRYIVDNFGKNRAALENLAVGNYDKNYIPFCQFTVTDENVKTKLDNPISLFGSEFYYNQTKINSRAFLFLHTLPFFGISDHGSEEAWGKLVPDPKMFTEAFKTGNFSRFQGDQVNYTDMFTDEYYISALFQNANGLIKLPKTLVLFIGALLWRYTFNDDDTTEPIVWEGIPNLNTSFLPKKGEYLYYYDSTALNNERLEDSATCSMHFSSENPSTLKKLNVEGYKPIPPILSALPKSVKDEFIQYFQSWVQTDFKLIKNELEIFSEGDGYVKDSIQEPLAPQETAITKESDRSDWQSRYKDMMRGFIWSGNTEAIREKYAKARPEYSGDLLKEDVFRIFPNGKLKENYIYLSPISYYGTSFSGEITWGNLWKTLTNKTHDRIGTIYNYHLHMKADTDVQKMMMSLYKETTIIQNNAHQIWRNFSHSNFKSGLQHRLNPTGKFNRKDYFYFLSGFIEEYERLNKDEEDELKKTKDSLKNQIFNTINDDTIKLSMYRTLSSIYNKWVAGTKDGKLFSQCNLGLGSYADKVAETESNKEKLDKGGCKPRETKLIDTFRFIDRAFNDIGDDLIINPSAFTNLFTNNLNKSAYDLIASVLSQNYIDFIPLPTFVNFKDINEVVDMFRPKTYSQVVSDSGNLSVGPAFICMYVGQTSTNLDLKSEFIDDGIQLVATSTGADNDGIESAELKFLNKDGAVSDFTSVTSKGGADKIVNVNDLDEFKTIPIIGVSYGQQNQNFFKDITLDQTEFTETEESLIIIDEIAQQGNTNKKTPIGQNLFNVFQTRSYNATVEAMGNPLIQPMMYFNLNNIPMFRGLYTILSVNHKITPHNMSTSFTGNRIRAVKTPLLENETIYMNLLGSVDGTSIVGDEDTNSNSTGKDHASVVIYGKFIDTPITSKLISINNGKVIFNNEPKLDTIDSDGSDGFIPKSNVPSARIYGMREVIESLQIAFKEFSINVPKTDGKTLDYSNIVRTNDISKLNGGSISQHQSHQLGKNIDIRPIAKTSAFKGELKYTDTANYSQEGTRQLIKSLLKRETEVPITVKADEIIIGPDLQPYGGNTVIDGVVTAVEGGEHYLNNKVSELQKYKINLRSKGEIFLRSSAKIDDDTGWSDFSDNLINEDTPITNGIVLGTVITDLYFKDIKKNFKWFKIKLAKIHAIAYGVTTAYVSADDVTFTPISVKVKAKAGKTQNIKVGLPKITKIYFNDPVLVADFAIVKAYKDHDNHLHIEYAIPERVEKDISNNNGENSRKFNN